MSFIIQTHPFLSQIGQAACSFRVRNALASFGFSAQSRCACLQADFGSNDASECNSAMYTSLKWSTNGASAGSTWASDKTSSVANSNQYPPGCIVRRHFSSGYHYRLYWNQYWTSTANCGVTVGSYYYVCICKGNL